MQNRLGVTFQIATEQDADGRWLAEVDVMPGVLAYGMTRTDAVAKVQALALRVLADRMDHGEADGRESHNAQPTELA